MSGLLKVGKVVIFSLNLWREVKENSRIRFETCVKMTMILDEKESGAKCKDRWPRKRARDCIGVLESWSLLLTCISILLILNVYIRRKSTYVVAFK